MHHDITQARCALLNLFILSLGIACIAPPESADSKTPGQDSGPNTDSRNTDSGSTDSGTTDSGSTDSGSTDSGNTDSGNTDSDPPVSDPIFGYWVSEGAHLAPVLASVYSRIDAAFDPSGTYALAAMRGADGEYDVFNGVFTVDTSTEPHTIVMFQTEPIEVISEGIWWATNGVLNIEVVQTSPAVDVTPPTPSGGFGSTAGFGVSPGDYTQIYVAL